MRLSGIWSVTTKDGSRSVLTRTVDLTANVSSCRAWQVVAHCHSCQIAVCSSFGLGDAFYMISEAKMHRLIVIRRIPADHSQ